MIWLTMMLGCGGPGECGVTECADVCARARPESPATPATPEAPATPASTAGLSDFEQGLVEPILEDVRAGIRAFGDEAVGICKGSGKDCEAFLGLTPGDTLPAGDHMIRAELLVPQSGERGTWQVAFDVECTTTRKTATGSSTNTSTYNKTYDVVYAGKDRGFRLQPLYRITSPNSGGEKDCKYTIKGLHPSQDPTVWSGSWRVPAAE
jgi:hypothetical protein